MLNDLYHLLFPRLCSICSLNLSNSEDTVCIICSANMVECPYAAKGSNKMDKTFWGRVPIEKAVGAFLYQKDATVAQMLHQLKYGGMTDLAPWIANKMKQKIISTGFEHQIDVVVPVPIHDKKLRVRGYNQAGLIASALGKELNKPVALKALKRLKQTDSQVGHTRAERMENVKDNFQVTQESEILGKNILLVDDVLTTGATLEACGLECLPVTKGIYICTAAYAM